jgi:hypothetical protein
LPSTKRIGISILIIGGYLIAAIIYFPSVFSTYGDITQPPHPRTFEVPMYLFLSGYLGFAPEADVSVVLTLTYPYGTLIIDEPVAINATSTCAGTADT